MQTPNAWRPVGRPSKRWWESSESQEEPEEDKMHWTEQLLVPLEEEGEEKQEELVYRAIHVFQHEAIQLKNLILNKSQIMDGPINATF